MNKQRRKELKMLKYERRLRIYRFKKKGLWLRGDENANLYAFRSHGKPCSCWVCSPIEEKYNRAKEKVGMIKTLNKNDI